MFSPLVSRPMFKLHLCDWKRYEDNVPLVDIALILQHDAIGLIETELLLILKFIKSLWFFTKFYTNIKMLDRYIFIMSLLILALMISTLIWWVAHVYKFMMFFSVKSQSCDIKAYISWWFLARLEVKINTNSFNTSPRNNIKASLFEKCKIILFILNRCVVLWWGLNQYMI